jgi:hypothetical protein
MRTLAALLSLTLAGCTGLLGDFALSSSEAALGSADDAGAPDAARSPEDDAPAPSVDVGIAAEAEAGTPDAAAEASPTDAPATIADAGDAGEQASACAPGATRCADSVSQQTCTSAGAWSVAATSCSLGCVGGQCAACAPGGTSCAPSGPANSGLDSLTTCGSNGQWGEPSACPRECVCAASAGEGNDGDLYFYPCALAMPGASELPYQCASGATSQYTATSCQSASACACTGVSCTP